MKCIKCGNDVLAEEKFCMNCGNSLAEQREQMQEVFEPVESASETVVSEVVEKATEVVVSESVVKMPETVACEPVCAANTEVVAEKKTKKGISVAGTLLIVLFLLFSMSATLFSWSSYDYKYYYDSEYEEKDLYSEGVVSIHRTGENIREFIDEEIELEGSSYRTDTLQYDHLWELKNGWEAVRIITMVAIIATLTTFVFLLVSAILIAQEIKIAKVFSIIGGIIMTLVSGAYAIVMPLLENIYHGAVIFKNSFGIYIIIGLSILITLVSIFYKGQKKVK